MLALINQSLILPLSALPAQHHAERRADERLLEELNLESLALARALIMEGRAFAGERKLKSPGELVSDKETMRVRGALDPYVSRGAHKLRRALEVFESFKAANHVGDDVAIFGCDCNGQALNYIKEGTSYRGSADTGDYGAEIVKILPQLIAGDTSIGNQTVCTGVGVTIDNVDDYLK